MEQYVIIGNGVAAVSCIEGIRSVDTESPITVLAAEPHPTYCRPLISYYLEGKTTVERMVYRKKSFYEENHVTVRYGVTAHKIEIHTHEVFLEDGESVPYTKLCIAAGSSPFVPPMKGLEKVEKQFRFQTLDDALALEQALTPDAKVLIVGAGLIGLKCAEGIHGRVASITVCDLAPRILSSIFDDLCAARMQAHLEQHGISFLLNDTVTEFKGQTAVMKSGAKVDFDILVAAVGVRANIGLVKAAGGNCNRGIVVDARCATSMPDVYAAGDCTEGYDLTIGANRVLALLPNANMQGYCAGQNMAGKAAAFDKGIPMNSIGFFGLHAMTAGIYFSEQEGGVCYEECDDKHIKRIYTKDDHMTGFLLIGDVEKAGIYTAMIRNRTPLYSVTYDALQKDPSFASFSAEKRGQIFGGVV